MRKVASSHFELTNGLNAVAQISIERRAGKLCQGYRQPQHIAVISIGICVSDIHVSVEIFSLRG
jgi:hypothetical protein